MASTNRSRRDGWRAWVTASMLAGLASSGQAAPADPAACVKDSPRLTYFLPAGTPGAPGGYPTPRERTRHPRLALPELKTDAERAALHPVLWPSAASMRLTIRQWVLDQRFDCVEQAFRDLDGVQARFPEGEAKIVTFIPAMTDVAIARNGMTEREVEALMQRWQQAEPDSMLVELLWPQLLNAAAWQARGPGTADKVTPEGWQLFDSLNAKGLVRVKAARASTQAHLLWHYTALSLLSANGTPTDDLDALTFAALKRFPDDFSLALVAANKHQPKWGGSLQGFETFASRVRSAVGPAHGDVAYAMIYTRLMSTTEIMLHPTVRKDLVRDGLLAMAQSLEGPSIDRLQTFACATRDEQTLRAAQALWVGHAKEPQLGPATVDLDAHCRAWVETLPLR